MNISDTGVKGFLKWLQADNPGLYEKVAPALVQKVPQAFSTYEASRTRRLRLGMLGSDMTGSSPGLVDISFDPGQLSPITPVQTAVNDASNVADVANSGSSSPGVTDLITNIVGGISSLWMAKNQVDIQKKVTDIQLQRAQAGLPPLPISTSQLGVPQISVGIAPNTQSMLMWGGLGLGAILLFGALSKGRK